MSARDGASRVLAVMAKAPRAGYVKTRLSPVYPAQMLVSLYRALVEDSLSLAAQVGAAAAIVCPDGDADEIRAWLTAGAHDIRIVAQQGRGLAHGLASCFEILCNPPGRRVIAFNSDTPHLAPAVLESAFDVLSDHDVVIGPCGDGGYYLVGMTRPHAGLFDAAAMGTASAFEALLARTNRLRLTAAVMREEYDVDVPDDLKRLARELATHPHRAPRTAAVLAAATPQAAGDSTRRGPA